MKIDKMLTKNVIEFAQMKLPAPIEFVLKKDRTLWFCKDFSELNVEANPESHPIPGMD